MQNAFLNQEIMELSVMVQDEAAKVAEMRMYESVFLFFLRSSNFREFDLFVCSCRLVT
jgi:hypothetical protein